MDDSNARIVWTAEDGWHDGPRVKVSLDDKGRLTTQERDDTMTCQLCDEVIDPHRATSAELAHMRQQIAIAGGRDWPYHALAVASAKRGYDGIMRGNGGPATRLELADGIGQDSATVSRRQLARPWACEKVTGHDHSAARLMRTLEG